MNKHQWTLQSVSCDGGEGNHVDNLADFALLPSLEQVSHAIHKVDKQLDITLEQYSVLLSGGMTTVAPSLCAFQIVWSGT